MKRQAGFTIQTGGGVEALPVEKETLMATLQWIQANPFGISFDSTLQTWNAGHVNDILAIGTSIVVASDSGGAWLINPEVDNVPISNQFPAICMSNDWVDDNMVAESETASRREEHRTLTPHALALLSYEANKWRRARLYAGEAILGGPAFGNPAAILPC